MNRFISQGAVLFFAYIPAALFLGVIGLAAWASGQRVWFFTCDPFVLGGLPFYAGILSNVSILLWCSSAAICFFAAALVKGRGSQGHGGRFLLVSGLLTVLFLMDDLFQMHRLGASTYEGPEAPLVAYTSYGICVALYLAAFRKRLLNTDFLLLVAALGLFGLAVVLDSIHLLPRGSTAASDGAKFFGIVTWFAYFCRTGYRAVTDVHRPLPLVVRGAEFAEKDKRDERE